MPKLDNLCTLTKLYDILKLKKSVRPFNSFYNKTGDKKLEKKITLFIHTANNGKFIYSY